MTGPKIGLVLGSGAARGWSHIGVIETLLSAGIVPDIICGTSIGALVGGVYASDRLAQLKDWALGVDWRTVASFVDINLTTGGVVEGSRIVNWLESLGIASEIEQTRVPFAAVATDLVAGREIWLQKGSLKQAIRASIALPGVFSPQRIDDRWLVDGGLMNPIPVSLCRAMGADFIIAVSLNEDTLGRRLAETTRTPALKKNKAPAERPNMADLLRSLPGSLQKQITDFRLFGQPGGTPAYFDVLVGSIDIMQDHIIRSRLAGEPPHMLIGPQVADIGVMDFHKAADGIKAGVLATELALPTIELKLKRGF